MIASTKVLLLAALAALAFLVVVLATQRGVGFETAPSLMATHGAAASSNVGHLTDSDDHKAEVEDSKIPVLIDFHATWCGPCQALSPHIEEVAKQFKGKVKVLKVDVDQNPTLRRKYGVRAMPTLVIVLPGGKGQVRSVGYQDLESLKNWIKNNTK